MARRKENAKKKKSDETGANAGENKKRERSIPKGKFNPAHGFLMEIQKALPRKKETKGMNGGDERLKKKRRIGGGTQQAKC